MSMSSDPFAVVETSIKLIPVAFLLIFLLRRALQRPKRRRFRASYSSLGNALQTLQFIVRPQIEHSIKEALKEKKDEDDEGGPDDPVAYYRRKMKEVDARLRDGDLPDRRDTK